MLEEVAQSGTVVGTPLEESGALAAGAIERLHALSVASVEELLGMIAADPESLSTFLGGVDLAQLQADIVPPRAAASFASEYGEFEGREYATGAQAPAGVEVEQTASLERFEEHAAAQAAADPPDIGPGVHLTDCFGPVRHQGKRSTCVAHAVGAVMECLRFQSDGAHIDLSEQFVYWDCKEHDGIPTEDGTYIHTALGLVESDGACLEETWPYQPEPVKGDEGQGPPPDTARAEAPQHVAGPPRMLGGRASGEIRAVLDSGRPVAFSIPQYNNWNGNPFVNSTGRIPMPLPLSERKGGHAMCAVGYRPDPTSAGGGYLIVRNSWGAGWASLSPSGPGYGQVPFAYVDNYGMEAGTIG
jgi:hypothetical protein